MKQPKNRVHFVQPYLLNPTNPIKVNLIGTGGTGSAVLTALVKINLSLNALGHCGLQVNAFDPDTVEVPNLARQLFVQGELGMNKSVALISRINRAFGTDWKAISEHFEKPSSGNLANRQANITLSCVDSISARLAIASTLNQLDKGEHSRDGAWYWMDFGNSKHTGQVMLATIGKVKQPSSRKFTPIERLPLLTDEYSELLKTMPEDNSPSCSLAQALDKQDLFINPSLANVGSSLLWSMLRLGILEHRGVFMNLSTFRTVPVPV